MSDSSVSVRLADQAADQAQDVPKKSADARADRPAFAWKEDPEAAAVTAMASSNVKPTFKTARTKDADAACKVPCTSSESQH